MTSHFFDKCDQSIVEPLNLLLSNLRPFFLPPRRFFLPPRRFLLPPRRSPPTARTGSIGTRTRRPACLPTSRTDRLPETPAQSRGLLAWIAHIKKPRRFTSEASWSQHQTCGKRVGGGLPTAVWRCDSQCAAELDNCSASRAAIPVDILHCGLGFLAGHGLQAEGTGISFALTSHRCPAEKGVHCATPVATTS